MSKIQMSFIIIFVWKPTCKAMNELYSVYTIGPSNSLIYLRSFGNWSHFELIFPDNEILSQKSNVADSKEKTKNSKFKWNHFTPIRHKNHKLHLQRLFIFSEMDGSFAIILDEQLKYSKK